MQRLRPLDKLLLATLPAFAVVLAIRGRSGRDVFALPAAADAAGSTR